jgi:radical SAM superfamily enzyme YgiQ (UPF0313 family)
MPASAGPPRPGASDALLINPFYAKDPHGSFGKHVLTPSLALTQVAAATPAGWDVRIVDENLLQAPPRLDACPNVVGITVHLTFARRAYDLARHFRDLGALVVLGGPHVTACPDEAADHADAIAIEDGVTAWPRILADVASGSLLRGTGDSPARRYHGSYRIRHYADVPRPARHLIDRRDWLTTASLIATRGCKNRCDFCYLSTAGLAMPYQARPVEDVAAEALATGEPYLVFIDNNLGADPDYLRSLCAALEPIERIWSAAVTIDVTDDPSLVAAMARSGCTGVFVGFESLDGANLTEAGKHTPSPDEYARRVAVFHEHGIQVNGSFILGFDHDGPDVFDRTMDFIESQAMESATFHILTPYPGTPLFARLDAEGRILTRDWARYDTAHAVFEPARMTPAELEAGYARAYERLGSWGSIWRRRPGAAGLRAAGPGSAPEAGAHHRPDLGTLAGYLATQLMYKKSNRLWPWLIRHRLTHALWAPLVEAARRRHCSARSRHRRLLTHPCRPRTQLLYSAGKVPPR